VFNIFATRVEVEEGEVLKADAEGLLLAANDHLWMGAGTALAIKQAGGEEIEVEAVRQGPLAIGETAATGGGRLAFRRIYHAVVMGQDLKVQHAQLATALRSALAAAARDGLRSMAVAPLESEELTGPFHEAARLVVEACFEELSGETSLEKVRLMTSKPESRTAYREAFHAVLGGGSAASGS